MWFPVSCARCGTAGATPCAACVADLAPAPALACPDGLDDLVAVVAYDQAARPFLTAPKYRGARASLSALGRAVAPSLVDLHPGTVVTWAPTTPPRRRARGFDHAELLARAVASAARLERRALLRRLDGPPQTGRTAGERREGPRFLARAGAPAHVVVVDDVCTTGATLTAAARALRAAGATSVVGLVVARTPAPATGDGDPVARLVGGGVA